MEDQLRFPSSESINISSKIALRSNQVARIKIQTMSYLISNIEWTDIEEVQVLQSGAFGNVFKAEYLGTEVAIKEFLDFQSVDSKKYTQREIEILRDCRHPNVLMFMGLTEHEQKPHIVTGISNFSPLKSL
jgi:serine/threonine protein kinase